ncbi:MAG TPA: SUF system NifU family Fe-S cluster assembly protein [Candidatus Bathyarchaeia archaeon]|nr:SUF system NifU family Fe-S cluster assembly protein [Candidatus Bathyarchaeia archaeon]
MSDDAKKRTLYEQVILDHNKNPQNCRLMPNPSCRSEGFNALCGDQFTVFLKLEDDKIVDVSFQGCGCAISKSSASIMTTVLKGKTKAEAEALFQRFHDMVTSEPDAPAPPDDLGKLEVFCGVREYPVRVKCATLAWHTMIAALEGKNNTVSTE